MHVSASRIGESKGSADHYAVRNPPGVRPKEKQPSRKTKPRNKQHTPPPKKQTRRPPWNGRALYGRHLVCRWIGYDLATDVQNNKNPARSKRRCKNKTKPISSAETQDPPSQDPGDRTESRAHTVHLPLPSTCNELEATHRQAPCRVRPGLALGLAQSCIGFRPLLLGLGS